MSEKKTSKKKCKGKIKCLTCEYYDKKKDFCEAKVIKNCSKQADTNFAKCEDYLVKESLVMF